MFQTYQDAPGFVVKYTWKLSLFAFSFTVWAAQIVQWQQCFKATRCATRGPLPSSLVNILELFNTPDILKRGLCLRYEGLALFGAVYMAANRYASVGLLSWMGGKLIAIFVSNYFMSSIRSITGSWANVVNANESIKMSFRFVLCCMHVVQTD